MILEWWQVWKKGISAARAASLIFGKYCVCLLISIIIFNHGNIHPSICVLFPSFYTIPIFPLLYRAKDLFTCLLSFFDAYYVINSLRNYAINLFLFMHVFICNEAVRGDMGLDSLSSRRDRAKLKWWHKLVYYERR